MTLGIQIVPPFGAVLQPLGKPGHNGVVPLDTFVVVGNEVVLTIHGNKFHRPAQNLQRIVQLDALADRYIGIGRTVQE